MSQVSAPLLHPVVGDGCPELSFAEANRKEDNGMNFRVIQKHVLGKARRAARRWDTKAVRATDTERQRRGLGRAACDPRWVWSPLERHMLS